MTTVESIGNSSRNFLFVLVPLLALFNPSAVAPILLRFTEGPTLQRGGARQMVAIAWRLVGAGTATRVFTLTFPRITLP